MKCCSVDVCIYSIILCFSDCHDSTCAFLIVMLILIHALFYSTCDYFSVCMKCIKISMYAFTASSTLLLMLLFVSSWLFCHFDIDVCIYSACTCFDCQADSEVDNVQGRELVNVYGV